MQRLMRLGVGFLAAVVVLAAGASASSPGSYPPPAPPVGGVGGAVWVTSAFDSGWLCGSGLRATVGQGFGIRGDDSRSSFSYRRK